MGWSAEQWEFANAMAAWLSAIGTVAAVIVALYLANRSTAQKGIASVGHRLMFLAGASGEPPEFVSFKFVNTGEWPIRITYIGWKVGLYRKRLAMQMFEDTYSSNLPIELTHGQEASWLVPLDAREEPWLEYFAKGMLMPNWKLSCLTLRAEITTSLGKSFVVRPDKNLMKKLRETCARLEEQSS